MNLSAHFELSELLASETATAKEITEQFQPSEEVISNLQSLAENVLEPLRAKLGMPIKITSGYRCTRLNSAIGGEQNSQHCCYYGNAAADTIVPDMDIQDWYRFIKTANIPFDELIIEHDSHWNLWCHISYDRNKKIQRGICMVGKKLDSGGTVCESDGFGSFLKAV